MSKKFDHIKRCLDTALALNDIKYTTTVNRYLNTALSSLDLTSSNSLSFEECEILFCQIKQFEINNFNNKKIKDNLVVKIKEEIIRCSQNALRPF